MDDLRLGDNVSCVTSAGVFGYCFVYGWKNIITGKLRAYEKLEIDGIAGPWLVSDMHAVFLSLAAAGDAPGTLPVGEYKMAKDVVVGEKVAVYDESTQSFMTRTVTGHKSRVYARGAYAPTVSDGGVFGGRIIVDGVVASQELGLLCTGPPERMQACYLRDVHQWASMDASHPGWGTLVDDLPIVEGWSTGFSAWTIVRWALDKSKLKKGAKPIGFNTAFAEAIKQGLADGEAFTQDKVLSLYSTLAWSN